AASDVASRNAGDGPDIGGAGRTPAVAATTVAGAGDAGAAGCGAEARNSRANIASGSTRDESTTHVQRVENHSMANPRYPAPILAWRRAGNHDRRHALAALAAVNPAACGSAGSPPPSSPW